MHNANWYAQRPLDAASLNERGIMEQVSFTEETSDHVRFSMEMAVEWAHLGGD